MDNALQFDYLVVGQGLAGSALAMQLNMRGSRICVFDEPAKNNASAIAAGLYNPITGKNMVKTWLADEIFSSLNTYYSKIEQLTGEKFFFPTHVYRPFGTVEEQNEWMIKSADAAYGSYIHNISVSPMFGGKIKDPLGGITLKQTGYVDTTVYLKAVRDYLVSNDAFREEKFLEDALEIQENSVRYYNITAKKIIFCQGVHNGSNRWFKSVPIISLKGETLNIQCEWKKDVILNRGVYLVPGSYQGAWRVGATYNFKEQEPGITAEARSELADKLNDLVHFPYTITGQQWGLRPTTPDRKPILGSHTKYRPLVIFNGLGTKGVSLAPYFSEVLIRAMENKGTTNKEADVTRFN